jgi:hypothetical protein
MRYLGLALYAEGPTDYRFLSPILRRLADDLCLEAVDKVEIGEVFPLDAPEKDRRSDRANRILSAAKAGDGAFDILFIHADGGSDPIRKHAEQIQPAIELMKRENPRWVEGTVAVVPVRETEAWALADGDALRTAFGSNLENDRLGLPSRIAGVESVIDPERSLRQAYEVATGRKPSGYGRAPGMYSILGEEIRLDCLRQLSAFRGFEEALHQTLRALRYLRGA